MFSRPHAKNNIVPEQFLVFNPFTEREQMQAWPLFTDAPIGTNIRYRFYYNVTHGVQDDLGYVAGLLPGHLISFNYDSQPFEGKYPVYTLMLGPVLTRTPEDVVFSAVAWYGEGKVTFGLVRAPLNLCPVFFAGTKTNFPVFGMTFPWHVAEKVMANPVENNASIRVLLPSGHPRPIRRCFSHITTRFLGPHTWAREYFVDPPVVPLPPMNPAMTVIRLEGQ